MAGFPVTQEVNALGQGGEGGVDVDGLLLLPPSLNQRFIETLAAAQVNEMEDRFQVAVLLHNNEPEDCMRSGALKIHRGAPHVPVLLADLDQVHNLTQLGDRLHIQVLHLEVLPPPSDSQVLLLCNQVLDLLVIDLKAGEEHLPFRFLDPIPQVLHAGGQEVVNNGMGLPAPCLTVSYDRPVNSLHQVLHYVPTDYLKNLFPTVLFQVCREDMVEMEGSLLVVSLY